MPNIFDPQWDQLRRHDGFTRDRAFIGRQAGAKNLGISIWELLPGDAAYPYHYHFAEEEAVIVLSGRPSLRTPEGWRALEPGELVAFPVGPRGAHQLINRTDERARIMSLSANAEVEGVVYPDSDKVSVSSGRGTEHEHREIFERSTAVDYWKGEKPPS